MKASELPLLVRSIRHTRPSQLWARLRLVARRRWREALHRGGFPPGGWYRAAAPAWRPGAPTGPVIPAARSEERLPLTVDLAGTPFEIREGLDWRPAALARGTYLERLNLHYMEYLDRLEPADAARLMEDWAARVPPYEEGYWRDTWNSYALSIRVVAWLDVLTCHRDRIAEPARTAVEQSLAAQVRFLERNLESDIGGNHLMKNLRTLLRAGSCFEGPEPRRWVRRALAQLPGQITEQILPDGMHFELSPAYHLQVMEDLMDMRRSLRSLEGNDSFARHCSRGRILLDDALRRMADVARLTTHTDGLPSLFADGGLHMAANPGTILEHLEREGLFADKPSVRHEGPWRLPHGGYVGFSGPDEVFIYDCGEVGADHLPAHGHGDAFSMEWSVLGRRLIIDPGVFEYHAGARRAYSRSTAAHSTVTVADEDQSEFWSSFRVGRRARVTIHQWEPTARGFVLAASHDGYRRLAGHPTHFRRIEANPGRITVLDEVRGGQGQPVRARLILAPDVVIESIDSASDGGCVARISLPAADATVTAVLANVRANVRMRAEVVDSSPDFGVSIPTKRLVLELGNAPCSADWSIALE